MGTNVEFGLPSAIFIGSCRFRSPNIWVIIPLCVLRRWFWWWKQWFSQNSLSTEGALCGEGAGAVLLAQSGFLGWARPGFVLFPLSSWPSPAYELLSSPFLGQTKKPLFAFFELTVCPACLCWTPVVASLPSEEVNILGKGIHLWEFIPIFVSFLPTCCQWNWGTDGHSYHRII